MNCSDFLDSHSDFIDRRLAESELGVMTSHLDECLSCQRYDSLVRRLPELLRTESAPGPLFQRELAQRLRAVDAARVAERRARRIRRTTLIGAGASAVLLAAAWLPVVLTFGHPMMDDWTLDTIFASRPHLSAQTLLGLSTIGAAHHVAPPAAAKLSTAPALSVTAVAMRRPLAIPMAAERDLSVVAASVRRRSSPSLLKAAPRAANPAISIPVSRASQSAPSILRNAVYVTTSESSLLDDYDRVLHHGRPVSLAPFEH